MRHVDKFLIGIVAGIVVLVGVAFGVALTRSKPTYQSDDTPRGIVHNYLLAMQRGDHERAYGYVSPELPGYPDTAEDFADDVEQYVWNEDIGSFEIPDKAVAGNRVVFDVTVRRFYSNGLFGSGETTTTSTVTLTQIDGAWKISDSDLYWAWCWSSSAGCR